jgi:hypothetical protein
MAGNDLPGSRDSLRMAFHVPVDPGQQNLATQSIRTMIARRMQAAAEASALDRELAALTDALNAPLVAQLASDARAQQALKQLEGRALLGPHALDALTEGGEAAPVLVVPRSLSMGPPYHFSWSWHVGDPPHNQLLTMPTGQVGLDSRSGSIADGSPGAVNAHAGFGIFLSTDVPTHRTATATISAARYSYAVGTAGIGGNATAEGGWECTVLENGQLIASGGFQMWRKRVSNGERSQDQQGPFSFSVPNNTTGLTFAMQPGRQYTFNVGLWTATDKSSGVGAAAAQSLGQGFVSMMQAW